MSFSKEEKSMWLEDWRKSGKKAWTYARENGLVPQTFVSWTKKELKQANGFIEIHPKISLPQQKREILIEKGDIKIHIPVGLNSIELEPVVESLRAIL